MKFSKIVLVLISISFPGLPVFGELAQETLKITVTGTRTERNVNEIPASITVFDLEEERQSGTLELKELFNYEPGVSVFDPREINYRSSAGNRGSTSSGNVNIRGLNKNRILMQQDGIRLPAGFYAVGYDYSNGNIVDYYSLSTIDVLKGPASVLYGSDALGGVISFNSLKPEDILTNDELFKVESFVDFNSNNQGISRAIRFAGNSISSEFSYLFVIGSKQSNEITPSGAEEKYINDAAIYSDSIYVNLDKSLNKENKISFKFDKYQKETNVTRADGNLANNYISQKSKVRSLKDRYVFLWKFSPSKENNIFENIKAKAFYQNHHTADLWDEIQDKGFARPITSDYNLYDKSYGLDLQFGSYVKNHLLTYGIDYSITENQYLQDKYTNTFGVISRLYDNTQYPIKRSPDTDTKRLGIYFQDELKYGKFDVITGIRLDNYKLEPTADSTYLNYCTIGSNSCPVVSLDTSNISPKIGITYEFNDEIELWGQYSRGFRAPSWWEMQASQINLTASTPYQSIPNPDLKSEKSNSYEIGFRGNYRKYNFELASFYNIYNNFIDTRVERGVEKVGDIDVITYSTDNVEGARIWGIEFVNEYNFTPKKGGVSLISSASYTHGQDLDNNTPLNNIDPFKVVSGIKYQNFKNNFSGELISTYYGKSRRKDSDTGFWPDPFITFDLLTKYQFKESLNLYFGIYNIFDKTYYKSANISSSQSTIGIEQFAEPGRHFKCGFKFIF